MTDNKALYRRFVDDVVVGKNVGLIDELFHADATLPAQGNLDGLRAQMTAQAEGVDVGVEYLHQFADGDWVITHMALAITHSGSFMGHDASGKTAHIQEIECVRVVDGRIAEMWSVADLAAAFIQLGLPIPGTE
jgi:predicted ester cyclase